MSLRYWFVLVAYVVMQILSVVIAVPLTIFGMDEGTVMTVSVVGSFAIGAIVIWFLMRNEPDPVRTLHATRRPPATVGWSIFWIFIGFILAIIGQNLAFQIQSLVFGIPVESENTQMLLEIISDNPWIILTVAIIGPIVEELVFRKAIFGHLYKKMNFFWAALISSVIFSVVHLEFMNILVYAAAGFVFAFLYVKTKRIIVPIFAHILMNAFASMPVLLELLFDIDMEELMHYMEETEESLQFVISVLGVLIS